MNKVKHKQRYMIYAFLINLRTVVGTSRQRNKTAEDVGELQLKELIRVRYLTKHDY